MTPGQINTLMAVFRWARRVGWRRQTQITTEWCWSRDPQAKTSLHTVSFTVVTGQPLIIVWGYGQPRVWSVEHALDILAAYQVIPATFSSAYAAGIQYGMQQSEAMDEAIIEDSVGAQLDLLLARLDTDEGVRTLAQLIERHPHGVPLASVPFERRAQAYAIADVVGELLGVDQ